MVMKKKRLLLIYNAHAGKGRIREKLSDIISMYSMSEYELIVHSTCGVGDAALVTEQYTANDACDLIVCAGGDGTLDEVAGAQMRVGKKIPIALIPAGSTNDFGYTLGISGDIMGAAMLALTGKKFLCDIASFNNRYFTYTAAFGLFSDVSYNTSQNMKNSLGRLAYIMNGITKLSQIKVYHLKVEYGGRVYEDDYIYGMVVSSNSVGGFKGITGDGVTLDDGLHELMLVKKQDSLAGVTRVVNELLSHKYDSAYIQYARVDKVSISSDDEIAWSLDGEFGGKTKRADIQVVKQGICYIRPQETVSAP